VNGHSAILWSLPWHARLKDLADALPTEGAVNAALAARKRSARQVTARVVAAPTGSWLIRARKQTVAVQSVDC